MQDLESSDDGLGEREDNVSGGDDLDGTVHGDYVSDVMCMVIE